MRPGEKACGKGEKNMKSTFMGYRRPDGRVGVRNYVVVIPSVFCANKTAQRIAHALGSSVDDLWP